jgi:hypothetical protein
MTKSKTVRLYPVPGVSLHPWPAVEFDATPDEWAELREYLPPPFTDKPPGATPDTKPTGPADAGPSDSED